MIKKIDYYPPSNTAFNKGLSGFYGTLDDGSLIPVSQEQADEFVKASNAKFDEFMGR